MRPHRCIVWAATLALAGVAILVPKFAASQPGFHLAGPAGACTTVHPTRLPVWTASGSWTPEGDLLLLDNLAKGLVRLSPTGEAIDDQLPSSFVSYLSRWYPMAMARHGQGYLIQVDGNRFASFDRRYSLDRVHQVNMASVGTRPSRPVVDKIFSWTATAKDVYAVADVKMPDGEDSWWSGFVRFPLSDPSAMELIEPIDDQERVFYRLSLPYLATTEDDVAYVLRMDNQMGIYRFERNANGETTRLEPVRSFEKLYPYPSFSPQLPIFKRPDDLVTVMRIVEQSKMPAGLYGGAGLYVLSREPEPSSRSTKWRVSRIDPDPKENRLLWTSLLPSQANHISVIAGPDQFAFVEKGPVRGMTVQTVKSLLLVPAARMKLDHLQNRLCG